MKEKSNYCFDF